MVKSSKKGVFVVDIKVASLMIEIGEADLLRKLVGEELDRRCQVIDDIIVRAYDVVPAKHTNKALTEVKVAILELVRSPMADLERKLACVGVKPEAEPKPEPEPMHEPEDEVEPEPKPEPAKSKA